MGFMKFQENEKNYFNEILKALLNRVVTMPPDISGVHEIPETTESSEVPGIPGVPGVPGVPEVPEVPEIPSAHLSNNPSYGSESPQDYGRNEDDVVPVTGKSIHWNNWRELGKKITSSSMLKSVLKGLLYLLGTTIVLFNIFILIALIQSVDQPDKNPLCQPTASTGYHIRDWVDETSEKVRYQVWKFNQWLETKSNDSTCSCPTCPTCAACPTCPTCPTCPICRVCPPCVDCTKVKQNAHSCDLKAITDIIAFQKGIIF